MHVRFVLIAVGDNLLGTPASDINVGGVNCNAVEALTSFCYDIFSICTCQTGFVDCVSDVVRPKNLISCK